MELVSICGPSVCTQGPLFTTAIDSLTCDINSSDMTCPLTANAEGSSNAAHMRSLISFSAGPCNKVTLVMPLPHTPDQISRKGS